ncbi:MAG: hypothetical protein JW825_06790 [Candidatus Methanofastidiosa archaeon]|nr:hypothetical protein [Candidatus Methanofastidiosa archaeon]
MTTGEELLFRLEKKDLSKEELCSMAEKDFGLLPTLLEGITSKKANVRYGCAKAIMDLSERHHKALYPYIEDIIRLLDSEYRIIVWNATITIANLATVDKKNLIDGSFERYFELLKDPYMVTVANVVGNSGKIALAKPYLIPMITDRLLSVEELPLTPHLTEECKRVIIQKAIESFDSFFGKVQEKDPVIAFVRRYADSNRPGLRDAAKRFIGRWS